MENKSIQKYCPKCSNENTKGAQSCSICGDPLTRDPVKMENTNGANGNTLELPCKEPGVKTRIEEFLEENSRKMAELYGEEFADQKTWGAEVAAKLIIAYVNKEKGDKLRYKNRYGFSRRAADG